MPTSVSFRSPHTLTHPGQFEPKKNVDEHLSEPNDDLLVRIDDELRWWSLLMVCSETLLQSRYEQVARTLVQ